MMERPENRRQHPATPSRRLSTPVLPEVRVGERPSAGVELSRFAVAGHSSTPADLTTRLTAHSAHRARRYGAREAPLEHQGEHYTIPYRGRGATGLVKPLRSILHGCQIPIYIAAIGPKSVEQAAEIADGWLPVWYSPYRTKFYREALAAGFRRAGGGKSLASFDVAPGVTVIPGDDVQACLLPSRARELLDALVVRIRDVDVPAPVGRYALGVMELAVARAVASPRGEEGAARVELLDAVVAVVCDVDVPAPVGRYAVGEVELPVSRAAGSPGRDEGAARVELLDAVVRIRDVDVPAPVGRQAVGAVELAVARAGASPGRDEGAARVELLDAVVVRVRDVV